MKFTPTPIHGVVLLEPKVFGDARGFFLESWREQEFADNGIHARFVQDNHSRSVQWTLRGLHFQVQRPQGKLVRVTQGSVYDAVVDLRRASPTFGCTWGVELSEVNHRMLWIPEGLAHGILVISPSADFLYKCTDVYCPELERTLAWDDARAGVEWPIPDGVRPKLSMKDTQGQPFAEIEKFP